MRYLIDTNIYVYMASDPDCLSKDVKSIIQDYDTTLCISAESVRELIVGYRNKGLCSKRWKSIDEMVTAIEEEFYVQILPLRKEHMETYARLEINEAARPQGTVGSCYNLPRYDRTSAINFQ